MADIAQQLRQIEGTGDLKEKSELYKRLLSEIIASASTHGLKTFVDHSECFQYASRQCTRAGCCV